MISPQSRFLKGADGTYKKIRAPRIIDQRGNCQVSSNSQYPWVKDAPLTGEWIIQQ